MVFDRLALGVYLCTENGFIPERRPQRRRKFRYRLRKSGSRPTAPEDLGIARAWLADGGGYIQAPRLRERDPLLRIVNL